MAKSDWGIKRACLSCGARFYDLHKVPIVCPKCETEFAAEDFVTRRRNARPVPAEAKPAAAAKKPAKVEDDDLTVDDDEDVDDVEDDADDDVIEDTSDLGEDDDDMAEVLEHTEAEDKE